MKANEENLLKFLDGTKQFVLPIYQRRYSWKKEQCEQLLEDVCRIGRNENITSHFLGSIVSREEVSTRVQQLCVIDGQQRLTTVSLLLSALGRAIQARDADIGIDQNRINGYYLFNEKEDGDLRYKQLLTKHDKETLIQLLEEGELPDNSSLLTNNYQFFEDKLKSVDLNVVYRGIEKLMIVSIALESASDNPQLIYESLNSTGLKLTQADLIRNYVLMGQKFDFQKRLYEDYWYPMEQRFGEEYAKRFDHFMRDFLTLKTRQIPNKGQVYESFKRYVDDKRTPETFEAVIKEIVHFSEIYVRIVLLEEPDRELHSCFEDIHALGVAVVTPFLLDIYEVYTLGRIEKSEVIKILRLVESYVFRRAICDIPTNILNKTFAALIGQIDGGNHLQSLKIGFSNMTGRSLFPKDDDFQQEFQTKDVYNLPTRNYLLRKLENHERKEPIRVKDYTIEHVMPQSLSEEWQAELGENWRDTHGKYLHTIGNLTLTGYNPELSNGTFIEKQDMKGGFLDSPLRLNESLREVERWDEDAIVKRAEILSEKALNIWPDHGIIKAIETPQKREWKLSDHPNLTGAILELFQQLHLRILNVDDSISDKVNKHEIVYKSNAKFAEIQPQAKQLLLWLKISIQEINDPHEKCESKTNYPKWVVFGVSPADELDYIMTLICQAYEKQKPDQP